MEKTFFTDYQNLIDSFEALKKSEANPFFKSKYVPLKVILPIVKENCKKHNFIFMQYPLIVEGKNTLQTVIEHESGKNVSGSIEIVAKDATDPQKVGGGLTYMRRYMLTCMFGLEEDDDDGNTASSLKKQPTNETEQAQVCNLCGSVGIKAKSKTGIVFWTCPEYKTHKANNETFKMIQPDSRTEFEKKVQRELDEIPVIKSN